MSLLTLFCNVDDFRQELRPYWRRVMLADDAGQQVRSPRLAPSEIMTILIHFHQSHYRNFKAYYTQHVMTHLRSEFPALVSYNRFVELTPTVIIPLLAYTCSSAEALAAASPLWMPRRSRYVTTSVLPVIKSLRVWRSGVRAQWAGFMASNSI